MRRALMAAAVLGLLAAGRAEAGVVLTATETGGNVVISGGGTINLAGVTSSGENFDFAAVNPSLPAVVAGSLSFVQLDVYRGLSGPTSFGQGSLTAATSGSGNSFGVGTIGNGEEVAVPVGYTSGAQLSGTSTYAGATFTSLGLTPGTYTYTFGSGVNADFFTFQVGPAAAATPEPATLGSLALAAVGSGLYGWRRSRRRKPA